MSRRAMLNTKGQVTAEYVILAIVVAMAVMAMTTYVQRSVNANLKMLEDQLNADQAIAPSKVVPAPG